jgi:hypothetical protein
MLKSNPLTPFPPLPNPLLRGATVYTQVGFTPLNPPEYRGETGNPVPSPLQGEG